MGIVVIERTSIFSLFRHIRNETHCWLFVGAKIAIALINPAKTCPPTRNDNTAITNKTGLVPFE